MPILILGRDRKECFDLSKVIRPETREELRSNSSTCDRTSFLEHEKNADAFFELLKAIRPEKGDINLPSISR
jgi:hypothetical protein